MSLRRVHAPLAVALVLLGLASPAAYAAPSPTSTATAAATQSPAPATPKPTTSPTAATASPKPSTVTPIPTPSPTSTAMPKDPKCDQLSVMCSGGAPKATRTASGAAASGATVKVGSAASDWGYINSVAPMAVDAMSQYAVPASVTIAQSILESGWGTSGLTVQGNAYFGIKCSPSGYMSPWQNRCLDFPTQEYSASAGWYTIDSYFRAYADARSSFMDHGLFLNENSRYASAFTTNTADDFIRQVAADGYATDPNYAQSVINIMQNYNLYMYDSPGWQIQAYYGSLGGNTSYLGDVTTDINCGLVRSGCWQGFTGGLGYWSPNSGAHGIPNGAILDRWKQLGYENSTLGYPTGEQTCNDTYCFQFFEGGVIYSSPQTGTWANLGAIRNRYTQLGSEHSTLGLPTGPETCGIKNNGCFQMFQGGAIYWSPSTGAWANWGAIRNRYTAVGSEHSPLGLPTGPEVCGIKNNGCSQAFEGGTIDWSSSTGSWAVWGAIRNRYVQVGAEQSQLGLPTGPEVCGIKNNGCAQTFEGGRILWSAPTGSWAVWGAIGSRYAQLGADQGKLGLPTGPETCGIRNGGCYQMFEGGVIYWSPTTGAWANWGAIRGRYAQLGSEHSALGLPTGPETCGIKNGGCYQLFEGGAVVWSSPTGPWESIAPLRAYYAANGYESGRLGMPTGPQTTQADGSVTQTYEGGQLVYANGSYRIA